MPRALQQAVVVVTGASSGIGRATAEAFAHRGATVVLAARRETALHEVARRCEEAGGRALVVRTDVTQEEAVKDLARRAIEQFGRIDVWVNNAAVSLFARFEEAPPQVYRRVIDTNLFGYIHGARAVLPYFREQGGGVLINNSSVFGKMGAPYLSAYIVSKFAIRGLSECLREELLDAPNIHVCTILPASIDTPIFQQAANYTGRAVKPLRPIYSAARVARAIVACAKHPQREVVVGQAGRMMGLMHALSKPLYERVSARQVETDHFQDLHAPQSDGNLFEPMPQYTGVSGGWRPWQKRHARPVSNGGRAVAVAATVLVPAAMVWLWVRRHQPTAHARKAA
jgi:NAD(P)-dependent dehydrogenase (short-subunit alcohol dehydrogenase family)